MPDDNLLEITVYTTGEIEIGHTHNKETKVSHMTLKHKNLRTGEEWIKSGYRIICPESEKDYWIKQAIKLVQKDCDEEIERQMKIKTDITDLLQNLEVK